VISLSAIEDFFNFDKPCPSSIKNCSRLRNEYKLDIKKNKVCTGCTSRILRNMYINKIKNA